MGKFNRLKFHDERVMQGLKQRQLADLLGVSYQAVQQWESGKTVPDPENILKINNILSKNSAGRDINFFTPESDIDNVLSGIMDDVLDSKTLSADDKIEVCQYIRKAKNAYHEGK